MNANGAFASAEAILSLLVLAAVLLSGSEQSEQGLEDLLMLQKEQDLLKVWAKKGIPQIEEMVADFEFVFPEKSGEILVNGEVRHIGKSSAMQSVSAEMLFFDSKMHKTRILVRVFK